MAEYELAQPLLASNILERAKARATSTPAPVSSGSATIDEYALQGGFRYGEITSMAGFHSTGKTLLTYHALTSHLFHGPNSQVAVIDTTGSFSPTRLRDVLVYRLEAQRQRQSYQQSGSVYEKFGPSAETLAEEAMAFLDRVKVMRVFDFAGVVDAVGEVSEVADRASSRVEEVVESSARERRQEIGDSDDELNDADEEMTTKAHLIDRVQSRTQDSNRVGMMIIDTMTNVTSSLMSCSQTAGQALLTSFMRTLACTTTHHHICTILTNGVVGLGPGSGNYKRRPEDNVSIFASTIGKPALGKTFAYLIDTSLFLSLVPPTSNDATIAFGDESKGKSWKRATVLEVVKDRYGTREGRWAAFEIMDEVKLVPCRD